MANLELEARLVKKFAKQSGTSASGTWEVQEFLVEYQDGSYSNKAVFSVWGEKIKDLERFAENDRLKVFFNINCREWKEKWYTSLRAWRLDPIGEMPVANPEMPNPSTTASDVPAGFVKTSNPLSSDTNEGDDDLPF